MFNFAYDKEGAIEGGGKEKESGRTGGRKEPEWYSGEMKEREMAGMACREMKEERRLTEPLPASDADVINKERSRWRREKRKAAEQEEEKSRNGIPAK